ncbi:MAG: dihydroorotate dehydrogenase-like protein [Thermoanaerobaculia bacterium]
MDLRTTYLGLPLSSPILPGASPLVDDLDMVRRLEDAGAPAIVMHSLFEEQIEREGLSTLRAFEIHAESGPEATSYFPSSEEFALGPDQYLEQVRRIKAAVSVPVIASLNGTTNSGWTEYAHLIEDAGADALELNTYQLATSLWRSGEAVEREMLAIVRSLKSSISIPVAVKLSPFYTSLAHVARQLDELSVDGLVLFNRFYQPDLDVEQLSVVPSLKLSDSSELLLRIRWLAILSGRLQASLALSGGAHTSLDVVKGLMAGADVVQVVSSLLLNGPEHLRALREGLDAFMVMNDYESLTQMRGSMSLATCPDPSAFERANYMRVLQSWRPSVEIHEDWRL